MRGAIFIALLSVLTLTVVIEAANRKANIRYVNSMPQFGKAKLSASSPQTLVFDQVPLGTLTDYTSIASQSWNFTTIFATNVTAKSDETDVDSDSYATVFTCQTNQRTLKNKMIYDIGRSISANKALLRTVNLGQYNYDVDVYNGSTTLFNNVPYCSASSYIQVTAGQCDFEWTVSGDKRRQVCPPTNPDCGLNHNNSAPLLVAGNAYTYYITPSGSFIAADAKKKAARAVEMVAEAVDTTAEQDREERDVNEAKEEKLDAQARRKKVGRKVRRHLAK